MNFWATRTQAELGSCVVSTMTQVIFRSSGAHRQSLHLSSTWEPRKASQRRGHWRWVLMAEKEFPGSVWAQAESNPETL